MRAKSEGGKRRRQEMSKAAAPILHSFIIIIYCKNNFFQGEGTIPHLWFVFNYGVLSPSAVATI